MPNTPAGPLIEHYNGHGFSVSPAPQGGGFILGVSCATRTYCWGVSFSLRAIQFNGHAWRASGRLPGPLSANSRSAQASISCRSATACWIVTPGTTGKGVTGPVALHLVHNRWRVVKMPSRDFTANNLIDGLACASANNCWAVGESLKGGPGKPGTDVPFAEHLSASGWSLATVTGAPAGTLSALLGVSCSTGGRCVAVGSTGHASQSAGFSGSALVASPRLVSLTQGDS